MHLHCNSIPGAAGRRSRHGRVQCCRLPALQPRHLMHQSGQSRATLQCSTPGGGAWHGPWGRPGVACWCSGGACGMACLRIVQVLPQVLVQWEGGQAAVVLRGRARPSKAC